MYRYWGKNVTERQAATCAIELTMPATPAGKTVYVYVELTNFYQNHRRYVKSRQDTQLRGEDSGKVMPATKLDTACAPMAKDANGTYVFNGATRTVYCIVLFILFSVLGRRKYYYTQRNDILNADT